MHTLYEVTNNYYCAFFTSIPLKWTHSLAPLNCQPFCDTTADKNSHTVVEVWSLVKVCVTVDIIIKGLCISLCSNHLSHNSLYDAVTLLRITCTCIVCISIIYVWQVHMSMYVCISIPAAFICVTAAT